MSQPRKQSNLSVLLLAEGEFSGVTRALKAALERAGCKVIDARNSLRVLGVRRYWHAARMIVNAWLLYRRDARSLIGRTRAAYIARSRVNQTFVDRHPGIDLVLLLQANTLNYLGARPAHTKFVIYTDYMNLLSKELPATAYTFEELRVDPVWHVLERETLHAQDHVFVMGSHVKPAIETTYDLPSDRISAVGAGPGLDLDIERDGRVKNYADKSILFVGKTPERKGLLVLLEAFTRVRERFPDAVLHVVTGTPGSAPGVVFHGSVDAAQLKELFYTSSVFAMPAWTEPLGLVFLEAMLSKAVCLGTNTGSIPELIQDGESGYRVEPGDVAAVAQRLITLLENPDATRLMAERAYAAAKQYWSWDLVVERMLKTVEALPEPGATQRAAR